MPNEICGSGREWQEDEKEEEVDYGLVDYV